jgi:hypothetical protein
MMPPSNSHKKPAGPRPVEKSLGTARRRTAGRLVQELTAAILAQNTDRAVTLLIRAKDEGWELRELEQFIIAPAVTRLGQMWQSGRLDEPAFKRAGAFAEGVERTFRQSLLDRPLDGI